jgi:hypothetical protein
VLPCWCQWALGVGVGTISDLTTQAEYEVIFQVSTEIYTEKDHEEGKEKHTLVFTA